MTSTIDPKEVAKFSAMADEWWDETGKFKPLHKFNPIRIAYIKDKLTHHFAAKDSLQGIEILDVGCGGGLMCEPLAQMGAQMTGIDASEKNIHIADIHAKKSNLTIDYKATSSEQLAKENKQYDVVLALEIIEHVADVQAFVESCAKLVKPGGLLFIATLNRTAKSLLLAKFAVEYVLRWVPAGTHDWKKFLKPSEINFFADQSGVNLSEIMGFSYNVLKDTWSMNAKDLSINYMMVFDKEKGE